MELNGYSRALMGFDFADASALLTARRKFAGYLIESGVEPEQAESDADGLNHSWEFATYEFCPTGKGGGIDPTCSPGERGADVTTGDKLSGGGYDHASAVANDPHAIKLVSVTPGKRKMPWDMGEAEYNSLLVVYRGGKPRGGYAFVTQDEALAKIHGGGKATAFRVLPSSKIFPDPEIEGEQGRKLRGIESLRIGSAVVYTDNLVLNVPFRHWKKHADLREFAFCPTGEGGGIDNSCSPTGEPGRIDTPELITQDDYGHGRDITGTLSKPTHNWLQTWQFGFSNRPAGSYIPVPSGKVVNAMRKYRPSEKATLYRAIGPESAASKQGNLQSWTRNKGHANIIASEDGEPDGLNLKPGWKVIRRVWQPTEIILDTTLLPSKYKSKYGAALQEEVIVRSRSYSQEDLYRISETIQEKDNKSLGKSFMLRHMTPWRGLMDMRPGSPHLKIFGKYVELRERRYHLAGQHDQSTHGLWAEGRQDEGLGKEASFLEARASDVELKITADVKGAAGSDNLRGLDFRLKSGDSLRRKMESLVKATGKSPTAVALGINDAVRYTAEFAPDQYEKGVRATLIDLGRKGYRVEKVKNYWQKGDDYDGINAVLRSPGGMKFEMQFHTKDSLRTKDRSHKIYEKFRVAKDPKEAKGLVRQMRALWRKIPRPAGAMAIGALATTGI